jgi:hypothetical protein
MFENHFEIVKTLKNIQIVLENILGEGGSIRKKGGLKG